MNLLCLVACSLLVWDRVTAKPPPLDVIAEELQLATAEILVTGPGKESFIYNFPNPAFRVTEGTTVSVFGVKTAGNFKLWLYSFEDNPNPEPFTIAKSEKGWKVQYGSASHKYEDLFEMPKHKFVWFLIERTNDYLALYRAGEAKPVLTAGNKVLKTNLNFNTLQKFKVSSKEEARWDFLGYQYEKQPVTNATKYPFLESVVQKIKKAYREVISHLKRCEYADANVSGATSENNARFFLTLFISRNCQDKKILVQLRDMSVRYKTILLIAGVEPPAAPSDDKCKAFIMDKKSLRL
ncbi:hypothetical protein E2C01_068002 [Portunus trituberculatus]|uniref:Uncharacterized protein n=1 Tax=Portunus trituberculatus TaxID=210409 RepID=A0A5B7HVE0_PORTR|nr:hypothetical protein [Portunus trituberculatus]